MIISLRSITNLRFGSCCSRRELSILLRPSGLNKIETFWRKGQDSNLRGVNLPVFKTGAFNHSATLPRIIVAQRRGNSNGRLNLLNRVTDNGFKFIDRAATWVAKVNFVMIAWVLNVENITLRRHEFMHSRDSSWFIVITT